MSFHILFWMLCAVIAANLVVIVIALAKAYRDEGQLLFSTPPFLNEDRHLKR
jgi:hypothetical protein